MSNFVIDILKGERSIIETFFVWHILIYWISAYVMLFFC